MVAVIFGALPMVSWRGEHVVFDSLDRWIPEGLKSLQARVVHLICAVVFLLMAWLLTLRAQRFAEYGDVTVHLQWSLAPVAWVMAVLLAATALVHAYFVVRPPRPAAHGTTPETSQLPERTP
jgi:TRAP-type C4-dicarboxylate transport system permease small subunit